MVKTDILKRDSQVDIVFVMSLLDSRVILMKFVVVALPVLCTGLRVASRRRLA